MDELIKYLNLLQQYSNNLLVVVVILLWGLRKWVFKPLSDLLDRWEKKLEHYFDVHDEALFTSGRIEKLLRDIHAYIFREEK